MNADEFLAEHGGAVRNALQSHARRMREAADGAPGAYARVFRESAEEAETALSDLSSIAIDEEVW